MNDADVTEKVRALELLDLHQLREEWRRLYGAPPTLRSPELLAHLLAWRIQADASTGLGPEVKNALREPKRKRGGPELAPGAKVSREWRGVRHAVEILDTGVRYDGERFASLSEVARRITGVRWNGPRFFGLR